MTDKYEEFCIQQDALQNDAIPPHLYYVKQTIPNACGTIAILHALANNTERLQVVDASPLMRMMKWHAGKSPLEIASCLEQDQELARLHEATMTLIYFMILFTLVPFLLPLFYLYRHPLRKDKRLCLIATTMSTSILSQSWKNKV